MKIIINTIYWFLFFVLLTVAGVIAVSNLNIPGGIRLYSVQSGSMMPEISVGAIVITRPVTAYKVGDIVTFKNEADLNNKTPRYTVTHRIYTIINKDSKTYFVTKGDANNTPDVDEVSQDLVLGKVVFIYPYLGHLVSFARTLEGLILLVIIPATLIVYSELLGIRNETVKLLMERRKRKLTKIEQIETEIGQVEINIDKWYRRLFRKLFK